MTNNTAPTHSSRRLAWAGAVIGFAPGGFFNLVPGDIWRDTRSQILVDGWFHVLHCAIALVGLWLLWTAPPAACCCPSGSNPMRLTDSDGATPRDAYL